MVLCDDSVQHGTWQSYGEQYSMVLFALLMVLAVGLFGGWLLARQSTLRYRREAFIRNHVFERGLFESLRKKHPQLDDKAVFLVARALRSFFLAHLRSMPARIGMPSRVVDDLWHEFILDTRAYHDFCHHAFGAYFHHIPATQMEPGVSQDAGLRRTWVEACREENINPAKPTRLPLLFAIDTKLVIAGGSVYSLTQMAHPQAAAGSCGGFACSGTGLAAASSDAGGGGSDAGGGDGGGCGGGCGGS